jgi:hypothetical protein
MQSAPPHTHGDACQMRGMLAKHCAASKWWIMMTHIDHVSRDQIIHEIKVFDAAIAPPHLPGQVDDAVVDRHLAHALATIKPLNVV